MVASEVMVSIYAVALCVIVVCIGGRSVLNLITKFDNEYLVRFRLDVVEHKKA